MSVLKSFELTGKVALVTGGTKGIGRAMATSLAQAGADIATVSRGPEPEFEQEVTALGRAYGHFAADLTHREQTKAVVPAVLEKMGRIDILVNCAGICPRTEVLNFPEADWDATLEIDLTASFVLTQQAGADMLPRGWGKVINVASVLALQGGRNVPAYAAAKHGLLGLTKSFANDWASKGVNVNAIAPGYFSTELTSDLWKDPERYQAILQRIPAQRWGQGTDIAGLALFLASPASDYINGSVFTVDGGWMSL